MFYCFKMLTLRDKNIKEVINNADIKCCLIGDPQIGKSTLVETMRFGKPTDSQSTVAPDLILDFPIQAFSVNARQRSYTCLIRDMDCGNYAEGQSKRLAGYSDDTDIFLLCFCLCDRGSFQSVSTKWILDFYAYSQRQEAGLQPLIFLCGLKADERDRRILQEIDEDDMYMDDLVRTDEGQRLARQINACAYFECSALSPEPHLTHGKCGEESADIDDFGVSVSCRTMFETAFRACLKRRMNQAVQTLKSPRNMRRPDNYNTAQIVTKQRNFQSDPNRDLEANLMEGPKQRCKIQ